MATQGMSTACWITKTTDIHSEYVIFIAFLQQQWLCKHTSVLCYTYGASLVIYHSTVEFVEKDMQEEELEKKGTTILCTQTHLLFLQTILDNPSTNCVWPHSLNCWSGR